MKQTFHEQAHARASWWRGIKKLRTLRFRQERISPYFESSQTRLEAHATLASSVLKVRLWRWNGHPNLDSFSSPASLAGLSGNDSCLSLVEYRPAKSIHYRWVLYDQVSISFAIVILLHFLMGFSHLPSAVSLQSSAGSAGSVYDQLSTQAYHPLCSGRCYK